MASPEQSNGLPVPADSKTSPVPPPGSPLRDEPAFVGRRRNVLERVVALLSGETVEDVPTHVLEERIIQRLDHSAQQGPAQPHQQQQGGAQKLSLYQFWNTAALFLILILLSVNIYRGSLTRTALPFSNVTHHQFEPTGNMSASEQT